MQKNINPEPLVAVYIHTCNFIKKCAAKVESKVLKNNKKINKYKK